MVGKKQPPQNKYVDMERLYDSQDKQETDKDMADRWLATT